MGDLKEAPTVHYNFPLLVFSLYITLKNGITTASEPIPLEYGTLGDDDGLLYFVNKGQTGRSTIVPEDFKAEISLLPSGYPSSEYQN